MNIGDYQPTAPAEVRRETHGDETTLVFVRELRHPPETVWASLTAANQLPKWAPYRPDRDLTSTGPVALTMVDGSDSTPLPSTVLQSVPPELLEYTWGEYGVLRWVLEGTGDGTRLTLNHTVADPDWIVGAAEGWHICLDIAELLLDGHDIGPITGDQAMEFIEQVHDHYAKALE